MTIYSTAQAAKKLNLHPTTVRRLCEKYGIGRLISPRLRLLTVADVATLKASIGKAGRPAVKKPRRKR